MMILDNNLKIAINMLQYHLDENSNVTLLIFENKEQQMKYIKSLKTVVINEKGVTINELYNPHILDGLRYKRYEFIIDKEVK